MCESAKLELALLTHIAIILSDTGMPRDDIENICYGLKKETDRLICCVRDQLYERIGEVFYGE